MKRKVVGYKYIILVILVLLTPKAFPDSNHDRGEHDRQIEYVLFGDKDYKTSHPDDKENISLLEDAVALALDQFNGSGEDLLKHLQNAKIPDLPKSINEFDISSNYSHRQYTHRGWNVVYDEKSHWQERQKILRNTVKKVVFSSVETNLDWFPWLSEKVYGKNNYDLQSEAFCELLYCIHILGDHLEAEKYDALGYVNALSRPNDPNNPGIIPDLLRCIEKLFPTQGGSNQGGGEKVVGNHTYNALKNELEVLQQTSDGLVSSKGGVDTEEEFTEYHQCAQDLLETLASYIPMLLKEELFFRKTFYE